MKRIYVFETGELRNLCLSDPVVLTYRIQNLLIDQIVGARLSVWDMDQKTGKERGFWLSRLFSGEDTTITRVELRELVAVIKEHKRA